MELIIAWSDTGTEKKMQVRRRNGPFAEQKQSSTYEELVLVRTTGGLGVVSFLKNFPNRFRSGMRSLSFEVGGLIEVDIGMLQRCLEETWLEEIGGEATGESKQMDFMVKEQRQE